MAELNYTELTRELFEHANGIAAMPLEEWVKNLQHAEDIAVIVDPTLYRNYIYSKKPEALKTVLEAAVALKAAVLKVQPVLIEEFCKEIAAAVEAANRL
jgi:hypothetical protein